MPVQGVTHIPYPYSYRPTLAMQPGDEDYGETVVNYLEKTVFKSLVAPEDVAGHLDRADPGRRRLRRAAG